MCNVDVPRFRLPDQLSSPWEANSSSKDGFPPEDLAIEFVAKFVTAKDIVDEVLDEVQALFCSKLWPSFCQQLKCKTVEAEHCGNDSRKQIEKTEASNAILLDEVDSLRAELEHERIKFNKVVQEAEEKALMQIQKLASGIQNDEHQKLVEGCRELEQKIQQLGEENLSLSDKIEKLENEAKISEAKLTLLDMENQTLSKTREDSDNFLVVRSRQENEKFQVVRSRRLSLKRERNDLPGSTDFTFTAGVRGSAPDLRRCESPHVQDEKDRLQFRIGLGCQASASDAERTHVRRGSPSTSCDGEADDRRAAKTPLGNLKVEKKTDKLTAKTTCVESPVAKEVAEDEAACQVGLGEKLKTEEALDVHCNQVEKASQEVNPTPIAADEETVDSDETVMDLDHQQTSQPQVIGIASDSQNTFGDELMEFPLATTKSRAVDMAATEHDVEDRSTLANDEPLASRRLGRPDTKPGFSSRKPESRSGKGSWRQVRPRPNMHEGNFIDSFLATPLEKALAQLAANTREQAETTNCVEAQPQGNAASAMGQDLGNCMEPHKKRKSTARDASSSAGSGLGMKGSGFEREGKHASSLKARPGYKFQETVRKRSEREALDGTECKQCKKFYDAVEADDKAGTLLPRCEHHNFVSRHRYKYKPPATPDGFWNIGFDDSLK